MKKAARIVCIVLLAIAASGLAFWTFKPRERLYAGKPLGFWLDTIADVSPGFDPPPVWQTLDTNTVPVLIKALEACDSQMTWKGWELRGKYWQHIPLSIYRRIPRARDYENLGINSCLWLYSMGDEARPAIPALIHLMKADRTSMLKRHTVMRGLAAECLGRIGEGNKTVSAALIETTKDPDPHLSGHAFNALREVDRDAWEKLNLGTNAIR